MLDELVIRFVVGGLVVSAFALIGDMLKPKPFAGLFGGAPSIAIATLALAFMNEDTHYVALEGRSMLVGALALAIYGLVVARVLLRREGRPPVGAAVATSAAWLAWLGVALGLWLVVLR